MFLLERIDAIEKARFQFAHARPQVLVLVQRSTRLLKRLHRVVVVLLALAIRMGPKALLLGETSKTFLFKRSQSRDILRVIKAYKKDYPHYVEGFVLNFAQYCYSLLPLQVRRPLYNALSRAKRSAFS